MRDVRPVDFPRSHQNALYAAVTSASGVAPRRSPRVAASSLASATSVSVRNSLLASASGRSSGVIVANDQMPCRSGWPSGVRDGLQRSASSVDLRTAGDP